MAATKNARARVTNAAQSNAGRADQRFKAKRTDAKPLNMGGLDEIIGFMLRRAQVEIFQQYGDLTEELGITTAQFSVIRLASANPGANQTVIANALGAVTPRMVAIIDDLERRGYLVRLPSTVDRRSHAIFLTPEGRKLHKILSRRVAKQNARTIMRLRGADQSNLLRMLRDLVTPLEDETRDRQRARRGRNAVRQRSKAMNDMVTER